MPNRYNRQAAANRLAAYVSPAERRKRAETRKALALFAITAAGFAALFGYAAWHDSNLATAKPVRLIGDCQGRTLGGQEESDFPAGCAWIVPVTPRESN